MNLYLKIVFPLFFMLAFMLEGLGINNGREVAYGLILLMPFFLFIPHLISKNNKKIVIPTTISLKFLIFLIFSLISMVFSVNMQNSIENLFLYVSLYLVFVFVFNYRDEVNKIILFLIFTLSIVFSIYSLLVGLFIRENSLFSIPIDVASQGYQFVYSAFGSHNHLGDFLLLPLTALVFLLYTSKFKLHKFLLFLLLLPYLIFSYSRSAYLDLILIILVISFYVFRKHWQKISKLLFVFLALILFILAVFIFVVPEDSSNSTLFRSVNLALQQKYNLTGQKLFLASRNKYILEGSLSLSKNPLVGIGPGNFIYASIKYTDYPSSHTITSHNLFLDIFFESGIVAGVVFLLLILQIFASIYSHFFKEKLQNPRIKSVLLVFLFIVMLLNFQTDYTYLIHSFFMLFFVLIGLIYEEKRVISGKFIVLLLSLGIFVICNLMIFSNIAQGFGNYKFAFYLYPFNKTAYVPLIEMELRVKDKVQAFKYLDYYTKIFKGDSSVLLYAGDIYYQYGLKLKAISFYEKSFTANNFMSLDLIKKIYKLKLSLQGKDSAKSFVNRFFLRLSLISDKNKVDYSYRLGVLKFCKEVYGNCFYKF